jgi:hypothetical protein
MDTCGMGFQNVGLKNRKKLVRLCEKYGLKAVEDRDLRETLIMGRSDRYPDRWGCVTFYELRDPDWPKLEDFAVSLSVSTGAWME